MVGFVFQYRCDAANERYLLNQRSKKKRAWKVYENKRGFRFDKILFSSYWRVILFRDSILNRPPSSMAKFKLQRFAFCLANATLSLEYLWFSFINLILRWGEWFTSCWRDAADSWATRCLFPYEIRIWINFNSENYRKSFIHERAPQRFDRDREWGWRGFSGAP